MGERTLTEEEYELFQELLAQYRGTGGATIQRAVGYNEETQVIPRVKLECKKLRNSSLSSRILQRLTEYQICFLLSMVCIDLIEILSWQPG